MIKIGIIGLGFVGSAMLKSFELKECKIHSIYDKYKNGGIGNLENILECDLVFGALPTLYNDEIKKYDLKPIKETLKYLSENNFSGIFVCKSTVEPKTSEILAKEYNIKIVHNPEFLTARTAFEDFNNQEHIVLGSTSKMDNESIELIYDFYKKNWPNADISLCTSDESESMKLFCNCFYATKVQFFNELYLLCKSQKINYDKTLELMLKNNWINPMHTKVPGPDGKLSYGGLCFPKDTNSLLNLMRRELVPCEVLEAVVNERNKIREDSENCVYAKK